MARIRGKDTKPELIVRRYLHARGLRYRLHHSGLPGRPDLVFPSRRMVVFVNGCFWHGHEGCRRATIPATRPEFWRAKIQANRVRDARAVAELEALGWSVRTVWQCSITPEALDELASYIFARDGGGHRGSSNPHGRSPRHFKCLVSTCSTRWPLVPPAHAHNSSAPRSSGLSRALSGAFEPKCMIRLRFAGDTGGF